MASLEEAIAAIKAGDRQTGRELLANLLQVDYNNEKAWLWLSSVVESDERRRHCLRRVLEINPRNKAAQRGLATLDRQQGLPPPKSDPSDDQDVQPSGALLSRVAKPTEEALQSSLKTLQNKRTSSPEADPSKPAEQPYSETRPVSAPAPAESSKPVETADEDQTEPIGPVSSPARSTNFAMEMGAPPPTSKPQAPPADDLPVPEAPPDDEAEMLSPALDDETDGFDTPADDDEFDEFDDELDEELFYEPPARRPKSFLDRAAAYWSTRQGKFIIISGAASLVVLCVACGVLGLVFEPLVVQTAAAPPTVPPPVTSPIPGDTPTPTAELPEATPTPLVEATFTATALPTQVVANTATPTSTPAPAPTADPNFSTGQVVDVIAGDVIDVQIDGVEHRVKYILIDTPKVQDPEVGTEPFGSEALMINRQLVEGQTVRLERDQKNEDEFGRLLRYVYVGDTMVNEELVRQGVARVELIPPNLKYAARLQEVERAVREQNVGIWSQPETQPQGRAVIIDVNVEEEYVEIQNTGDEPLDLTGWRLVSELGGEECPLETVLGPGETVRVWALLADQDKGGINCGYTQNIWDNTEPDPAVLYNPIGTEMSRVN